MLLTSSVAGRRALPGSLYSATKWAVCAMGEALRQEVADTADQGHADRARAWWTRRSSTTPSGRPGAGRHRPRGDVRPHPASARGRERGAGPPDQPAALSVRADRHRPWFTCRRPGSYGEVRAPTETPASPSIAHVDMDAFYVSVELQRRPRAARAARGGGRAAVPRAWSPPPATRRARTSGSSPPPRAERARRLCPDAVFVAPRLRDSTGLALRDVMDGLRARSRDPRGRGPDEAYMDLTRPVDGTDAARPRRIKAAVHEETGLRCSIGIGPNKLVAKVASDADKPDGFLELTAAEARERFGGHSPGLIPGIGPKTVAAARGPGHHHARALAAQPDERAARSGSAAGSARTWAASPASRTSACWRRAGWPSPSRGRPPSTATCTAWSSSSRCSSGSRASCARRSGEQAQRGRTIGIKVRFDELLHGHAGALPRGAHGRARHRLAGGARPAAPPGARRCR